MLRIGVLISGSGSNLQAIIDEIDSGNIRGEISLIISNREDAYGLERGKRSAIESIFIDPKSYKTEEDYNLRLVEEFQKRDIDLIVLAGYLKILSKDFIKVYKNRIINIHPSLIPSFCGDGFYGSRVHKAIIDGGCKISGATVHFVDEGTDTGPIILQKAVEVRDDDSPESLQKRVLEIEHEILPRAVGLFCQKRIVVEGRKTRIIRGDQVKRVLISVYNKEGIVDFSQGLMEENWEIISTGGTSRLLKEAGIDVLEVEEITNFPEILDGRVKTLNPYIHGGLLYRRDLDSHVETVRKMDIGSIDMVVNNLYPFEETIKKENVGHDEIIENIDIGGPSMIRAAAKNYKFVSCLVDPKDYPKVLEELRESGQVSLATNKYLAAKVFNYTAYYDGIIANYFNKIEGNGFPDRLSMVYRKKDELRYGENPHQKAAFYEEVIPGVGSLGQARQIHGKELSFNNINDSNGALKVLKEFDEATVVAVKHANPCGIGSGSTIIEAYDKAYESDKSSIFGGIIAANREINRGLAEKINEIFIEVVLAPSFSKEAIEILGKKKNIRLLEVEDIGNTVYEEFDMKKVMGGILLQDRDVELLPEDMEIVTKRAPSQEELEELVFAWKAAKNISSNGVVISKDKGTIGIGLGEVNRYWAVENAIERAGDKIEGSVLASDGFFPFKDSIEVLGKAGIKAIIQPGGSIKDEEIIEEANKHDIAMLFTKMRHFRH